MYVLGKEPPKFDIDVGAGKWCSDPITPEAISLKILLESAMPSGSKISVVPSIRYIADKFLPDSVKNMNHFLGNTGSTLHVNMEEYMDKSDRLYTQYRNSLKDAKAFAETMPPGGFSITTDEAKTANFRQSENLLTSLQGESDLFFAIGGYKYWGQADFTIEKLKNGKHKCEMIHSFHFFDTYNWDGGKSVTIGGKKITDETLQILHKQCMAKEYDVKGLLESKESWEYNPTKVNYSNGRPNNDSQPRPAYTEHSEKAAQEGRDVLKSHEQGPGRLSHGSRL